jgi:ribosome-associated translation inhibitor RaiA
MGSRRNQKKARNKLEKLPEMTDKIIKSEIFLTESVKGKKFNTKITIYNDGTKTIFTKEV